MRSMNIILHKGSCIPNYENVYNEFSQRCLAANPDLNKIKVDFSKLKGKYIRSNQTSSFCDQTLQLARMLVDNGKENLANIFINEVGKIYKSFRNYEQAECLIRYSMEISRKAGDNFHVLARLNDLEDIARKSNDKRKTFRILRAKKECIKEIIANYDENVKNFQTIIHPPTSLNSVKMQLAYTYSGISDMLWYSSPVNSLRATKKAIEIYEEIGGTKQLIHLRDKKRMLEERIARLNNRNSRAK